jgi:hypothetical protein
MWPKARGTGSCDRMTQPAQDNSGIWTSARLLERAVSGREVWLRHFTEEIRDDYLQELPSLFPSRAAWQKTYVNSAVTPGELPQLRAALRQIFPDIQVAVRQEDGMVSVMIHLWGVGI